MKFSEISESTTAGSVASVAMPLGGTQKRAGSLFKGKKTKKKFYEGEMKRIATDMDELSDAQFKKKYGKTKEEMRKGLREEEIIEADLIIVPGQMKGKDKSFIPHDKDRRDHEVEMARSDLYAAAKDAMRIYKMIKERTEDEGLMGWQQSYITLAADYLNSVADSLEHDAKVAEMTGGVLAGGAGNLEEAKRDQFTTRVDDEGNVVKVYPPSGPKTQKAYVKSLVKNLGSSHIGKRGESPRGDKVGKGANLKGSTVAKLSGGMSATKESVEEGADSSNDKHYEESIKNLQYFADFIKYNNKTTSSQLKNMGPINPSQNIIKKALAACEYIIQVFTQQKNQGVVSVISDLKNEIKQWYTDGNKPLGDLLKGSLSKINFPNESVTEEKCPHCGGEMVSEELMNEKKDACYYKVKSRYKVWPSAYASGALVKCRKKGAKNWGNKSK